jgi:hypothetical protein
VLTVEFTVMGIPCLGLNGGPNFKHNEAFSFQVATIDQAETDRYWNAIVGNGGEESACGPGAVATGSSLIRECVFDNKIVCRRNPVATTTPVRLTRRGPRSAAGSDIVLTSTFSLFVQSPSATRFELALHKS